MKKKTCLLSFFLYFFAMSLVAMEKPTDEQSVVLNKKIETVRDTYRLNCFYGRQRLCLPQSLSPEWSNLPYPGLADQASYIIPTLGLLIGSKIKKFPSGCIKQDTYRLHDNKTGKDITLLYTIPNNAQKNIIFDGVNKKGIALVGTILQETKKQQKEIRYKLFCIKQAKGMGHGVVDQAKPFLNGYGELRSLALEDKSNHFMTLVVIENFCSQLCLQKIVKGKRENIAECVVSHLMKKITSAGNGVYFGISENGNLHRIKEGTDGNLICSEEDENVVDLLEGSLFHDIAVERLRSNANTTTPKIALLTKDGELYGGSLCENSIEILLEVAKLQNPEDVERLYYYSGKISLVNKDDTIVMYGDK